MNPDYITDAMLAKTSLEWFACDEDGTIAWFESCGYAPIPESVRVSNRDREESIELVKQLEFFSLTIRYPNLFPKAELERFGNDLYDPFAPYSSRGLYTYELTEDRARTALHERVTAPATPIHLDQLPPKLRAIIARTQLPCQFS